VKKLRLDFVRRARSPWAGRSLAVLALGLALEMGLSYKDARDSVVLNEATLARAQPRAAPGRKLSAEELAAVRETVTAAGAGDRVIVQGELNLEQRGLLPGDTLRYFVAAWDNAPVPQRAASREYVLRLPSRAELRAAAREAAASVAAAAESVSAAQGELADRARDLAANRVRGESARTTPAGESNPLGFRASERATEIARTLASLGFTLVATRGTAAALAGAGLAVTPVNKVQEGRPHIVDMIKNGEISFIVNTVEEKRVAVRDSYAIRRAALQERVPIFTTLDGARAACTGIEQATELRAYMMQGLHAQLQRGGTRVG